MILNTLQHINVIIAEDHQLLRDAYCTLLKEENTITITGLAGNGKELLELLEYKQPHVILLDIEMPVMTGNEALRLIHKKYPEMKVIILSMHYTGYVMQEFIAAGAYTCLSKNCSGKELVAAIYAAFNNINAVIADMQDSVGDREPIIDFSQSALSDREAEILKLACDGKLNKQIAGLLNIRESTVDFHKKNLYVKTKSDSMASLIKYAIKNGYTTL